MVIKGKFTHEVRWRVTRYVGKTLCRTGDWKDGEEELLLVLTPKPIAETTGGSKGRSKIRFRIKKTVLSLFKKKGKRHQEKERKRKGVGAVPSHNVF